ncbi:30S ribosome-binding factor RbfA [Pararhodobacter oceanensis]|uniref:Ribosome-binding factor A n=2 Tax=Pararhodobacter oceanensis TaxID=2172121 RepID=A0A2T8HR64_9RHOB|nr:30S ribosome-binding factor RbfA [Pararhodobacter oceanensis]
MGGMSAKRFKSGSGPSQRQLRVAEVIRHRLAEILMRDEIHNADLARMSITVSEVRISADLGYATAFVMPLGGRDAEAALLALRKNKTELRKLVVKGLGLRLAPDLKFELDKSFDAMDNARRMFADPRVQADINAPDRTDDTADAADADDADDSAS